MLSRGKKQTYETDWLSLIFKHYRSMDSQRTDIIELYLRMDYDYWKMR